MPFAPPLFHLDHRPDRTRVSLVVGGEVDIETTPRIADAIDALLADGWRDVVADLRGVSFIDSTGVSLLVHAARRAGEEGWRFAVVAAPGPVDDVLEMTGADELLVRVPPIKAP